jgi:hypothetical protein
MAVNNEDQHKQAGDHRPDPGGRRARRWRWCCGCCGEGNKRHVTEIDATEVVPSLKWAIAAPEKAVRTRITDRRTRSVQRRAAVLMWERRSR